MVQAFGLLPGRPESLHHNETDAARVRDCKCIGAAQVVEPRHCISSPSAGVDVGRAMEGSTDADVGRRVTRAVIVILAQGRS